MHSKESHEEKTKLKTINSIEEEFEGIEGK